MTCTHDIIEKDNACADGMCPLCLAADNEAFRLDAHAEIERWRAMYFEAQAEIERLVGLQTQSIKEFDYQHAQIEKLKDEIERLKIRIRQDAEAALSHLDEIDRLNELVAALREEKEKLYINVAELRELEPKPVIAPCDDAEFGMKP